MDIVIYPKKLQGTVSAIPSKSMAHRLLIASAFADGETQIRCRETNSDMEATADCLRALGAKIHFDDSGYRVNPLSNVPKSAQLPCRDSGSTLRFLLPVVGALGVDTTFHTEGRLAQRPLSPLWEEMERMGCQLSRPAPDRIRCQGKLLPGHYSVAGNVSSQFITGLLFAQAIMKGNSTLEITGHLESAPYVTMTKEVLSLYGNRLHTPSDITVEGDWSNAAFFLAAEAMGSDVTVEGLKPHSSQGDRAVCQWLSSLKSGFCRIDASDIPDLVPILSTAAAFFHGAEFQNIQRLRMKESDRVASVIAMLQNLGGTAYATDSQLTILGTGLTGGTVDSCQDHRIAMSAAIAASLCRKPVTILGAECVRKSYPHFWADYKKLGGHYEQHLR